LQRNPQLYRAMVENGVERGREFRPEAIAQEWINLLSGPVSRGYEQWRRQSALFRWSMRPLRFAARAVQHKRQIRRYQLERDHGFRPVSGTWT
jgi:hypothetical protein